MKAFLKNYWKTICWAILIAVLLFSSGENLPKKNILKIQHLDKAAHFFLFLGLEFLISIEYTRTNGFATWKSMILITFVPILYAGFTEFVQLIFIFERDGAWLDFVANILGIVAGFVFYFLYQKRATNLS